MNTWDITQRKVIAYAESSSTPIFLPGGGLIAIREPDNSVSLADAISQESLTVFTSFDGDINSDGTIFANIEGDKEIVVYDVQTGDRLDVLKRCPDDCSIIFSPNDQTLLVSYANTIEQWGVKIAS